MLEALAPSQYGLDAARYLDEPGNFGRLLGLARTKAQWLMEADRYLRDDDELRASAYRARANALDGEIAARVTAEMHQQGLAKTISWKSGLLSEVGLIRDSRDERGANATYLLAAEIEDHVARRLEGSGDTGWYINALSAAACWSNAGDILRGAKAFLDLITRFPDVDLSHDISLLLRRISASEGLPRSDHANSDEQWRNVRTEAKLLTELIEQGADADVTRGIEALLTSICERASAQRQPDTPADDLWWLQALRDGDDAGLHWMLDRHGTWIYSQAYRLLRSHEHAEEAWQDTFRSVWQKIDTWDPDGGDFRPWLNDIAKNAIIEIIQKQRRLREVAQRESERGMPRPHTGDGLRAEEHLENPATRELIEQALELVPKSEHRVAWTFHHLEGMTIAEISEALGHGQSTVRAWISRGTRDIARILAEQGVTFVHSSADDDALVHASANDDDDA